MILALLPPAATSATAALRSDRDEMVIVGMLLSGTGTSPAEGFPAAVFSSTSFPSRRTTPGLSSSRQPDTASSISELRRLSGLTWEQMARLLGVSRRSLHFWASGKTMTPSNEEHLQRALAVVRSIDRGSAGANRRLLLEPLSDGNLPFDLLASGHYGALDTALGQGRARRPSPPRLSAEARAARAPVPPSERVGALQDPIHQSSGKLLGSTRIRVPRKK